jgi:DNA-binding LacI/PurR family transcriptional regulator
VANRRRVTIRDVAELAGVSPTTASDALNGKGRVDAATRERVRGAAGQLAYHPSRLARGLRYGRSSTLGLMLPHGPAVAGTQNFFGIDFYLELAVGAAQAAFTHRNALTLLPDVVTATELGGFALDGVIVNDPLAPDPRLEALDALGTPYVTVERALDRPDHSRWVSADTPASTHAVLDHLADRGAEHIALVTVGLSWAWLADTEAAYRSWCERHGRERCVVDIAADGRDGTGLLVVDAGLVRALEGADAVFTASDRNAVSIARALTDAGRHVGQDVLLACGVDSRYARHDGVPITALDLHPAALGTAAAELLLSGQDTPTVLPSELHVRASSAEGLRRFR